MHSSLWFGVYVHLKLSVGVYAHLELSGCTYTSRLGSPSSLSAAAQQQLDTARCLLIAVYIYIYMYIFIFTFIFICVSSCCLAVAAADSGMSPYIQETGDTEGRPQETYKAKFTKTEAKMQNQKQLPQTCGAPYTLRGVRTPQHQQYLNFRKPSVARRGCCLSLSPRFTLSLRTYLGS